MLGVSQSLQEIDDTYQKVLSALDVKYSKDKNIEYNAYFAGLSTAEIEHEYTILVEELDKEMSMAIFANVEAVLRLDFISRCQLKKKDNLSLFYRKGYNSSRKMYTYGLVDVVLKGWKQYMPELEDTINCVIDFYTYRNWLAHGRYWVLGQPISKYSYLSTYTLFKSFLDVISPKLFVVVTNDD